MSKFSTTICLSLLLFCTLLGLAQDSGTKQGAEPCLPEIVREFSAKVVGITDGDTLRVLTDDKNALAIRLEGIDAPEKAQEHGTKAKEALDRLVGGKTVTIKQTGTDKYRRTLALVFADNVNVNAKLVEDGWAWHYKKYNCDEQLAKLEADARTAKRGLWSHERPMAPWEFRHLGDRKEAAAGDSKAVLATPPTTAAPSSTAKVEPVVEKKFWLNTGTKVRHASTCKHFGNTKNGRFCGPTEGKACGICGG